LHSPYFFWLFSLETAGILSLFAFLSVSITYVSSTKT
jgi:hypothetical protein